MDVVHGPPVNNHSAMGWVRMDLQFGLNAGEIEVLVYTIILFSNRCSRHLHIDNLCSLYHCSQLLPPSAVESLAEISLASFSQPGGITAAHAAIGVQNCIEDSQTTSHSVQWTEQIQLHFITFCRGQIRFAGFRVHCWGNTTRGRSSGRCC